MANHKLYINDFEAFNYLLIAIHTDLDDYKLAFLINQTLQIQLKKCASDIILKNKEGDSFFSRFEYNDDKNDIIWNLFENQKEFFYVNQNDTLDLFSETTTTSKKTYMLPEFKKADFFLKIEHTDAISDTQIVAQLNKIERIQTVYNIELGKIKNGTNLIF